MRGVVPMPATSPERPRAIRWTRDEYYRLADLGLFVGRRVQLLNGEIIEMPAMKNPHVVALNRVRDGLLARLPAGYELHQQVPITRGLAGVWLPVSAPGEPAISDPEP